MQYLSFLAFLALLTFSCAKEDIESLSIPPGDSSYVNLSLTDIHTKESVESGIFEVSPVTTRLASGVYYKGPNSYITKDVSFDITFPTGEVFEATLQYHKPQEDPQLIEVDAGTEGRWRYYDSGNYYSYYGDHFRGIHIRKKGTDLGGTIFNPQAYEASQEWIDGMQKVKVDILLDSEFLNSVYLPRAEQRGFHASGTLTLFLE